MKKRNISIFVAILFCLCSFNFNSCGQKNKKIYKTEKSQEFKDGDIIFQIIKSEQTEAIQLATKSKYSHVGIIYKENGKTYVYEAVQPVRLILLKNWIKQGKKNHYVVKRLKNADKILDNKMISKMKKIGEKYKGKDYDFYFQWSDDRIYCSELVWKIYKEATGIEIGKLKALKEYCLDSPIVKQTMKARYGNYVPWDEKMISPGAMFDSDKLITIFEN